jgi:hypothetical protein
MEVNANLHAQNVKNLEQKEKEEKAISEAIIQIDTQPNSQSTTVVPEITEKSYETSQPSKKVIETTVKKGPKEIVYRKVVSKLGTYYYKDNTNITEDQWQLETFRK